ncbi:AI-2E family transporter [Cyanobium sp. Morenito 9A2]|uniref:AI-2E family transporter n=1 Tax=Cyanobium sp. Morenito 9A2 TaxID=2823718 RepID=UPI0020CE6294|nr:AI-2E family transporter [Cyanobium sp. Morenito 9A2]MCP9850499.1 AI-2E family transporter [Cyanobium sp. Morenito 9A2]
MSSRKVLGLLAVVVVGLLLWELRWVLLVFFGAVVLAVSLDVPVSLLRRLFPLNRPSALVIVLTVIVVVGYQITTLLLPELLQQINEFASLLPELLNKLSAMVGKNAGLKSLENQLNSLATFDRLQPLGAQLLGVAGGAANSTIQLLLMTLLALLLALDPRSHQRMLIAATPNFYRKRMQHLLHDARQALGGWLAGMTVSAITVFLLTWAGLAGLGLPLALLSGLVCGLLTFVPTIGPTFATLLPLAVALLTPEKLIPVLVLRLLLQNGEAFLLTPLLLRRTVNLLPTVALMAQLCLGALLGLPGVLLALPLVVVLQVVAQQVLVEEIMDPWNGSQPLA